MAVLLWQDLANVEAGLYPLSADHDGSLLTLIHRSQLFFEDLPEVYRRRESGAVNRLTNVRLMPVGRTSPDGAVGSAAAIRAPTFQRHSQTGPSATGFVIPFTCVVQSSSASSASSSQNVLDANAQTPPDRSPTPTSASASIGSLSAFRGRRPLATRTPAINAKSSARCTSLATTALTRRAILTLLVRPTSVPIPSAPIAKVGGLSGV
jgi:hypothetical protein